MHVRLVAAATLLVLAGACGEDDASTTDAASVGTTSGSQTGAGAAGGSAQSGGSSSVATTSIASSGAGASGGQAGAGGAPSATVPCDGGECAVGQVCCFDNTAITQDRCDAPGACDGGHIELSCNHPDDCADGDTCCSAFDGMVQTMECKATCVAGDEYVMCSGPDQAACPDATTCSNAQAGQGYHYCAK